MLFLSIVIFIFAIILFLSIVIVNQQNLAIVQRLGKFLKVSQPGLNFLIPFIDSVVGRISLRVNQLDVKVETKTEDNVFLHVMVSVQFFVQPEKVYEAFYKLQDPKQQITAFVFDVVRARVPKIKLDDVFEKKDEIANAVKEELSSVMNEFGYGILKALVTDIDPDKKVKEAMNEINVAQRMRVAATEKGEAERIIKVKSAEADAQSKALQGKGMADQRTAIIHGLKDSVADFKGSLPALQEQDILNLVLVTQYFDTLKDLGLSANNNTIMIPHSPSAIGDIMQQFSNSLLATSKAREPISARDSIPSKKPISEKKTISPDINKSYDEKQQHQKINSQTTQNNQDPWQS
jgi:regulator of protease activity HflC (stomatin/prohibitin superfamily)